MVAENYLVQVVECQEALKFTRGYLSAGTCFWYLISYKCVDGRPILQLYKDKIEDVAYIKTPLGGCRLI